MRKILLICMAVLSMSHAALAAGQVAYFTVNAKWEKMGRKPLERPDLGDRKGITGGVILAYNKKQMLVMVQGDTAGVARLARVKGAIRISDDPAALQKEAARLDAHKRRRMEKAYVK